MTSNAIPRETLTRRRPFRQFPHRISSDSQPAVALALIWAGWLVSGLVLGLLEGTVSAPEWFSETVILLHVGVAVVILARTYPRRAALILSLALLLRTMLVFWDLHLRHVFTLPHSGADTEMFFRMAVGVAEDPTLIFESSLGGAYSKLFGLLFWVTGVHRDFGQYTNVLLGVSTIIVLDSMLANGRIGRSMRYRILAVGALLPNVMLVSSVFLRESVIAFLVTVSLYFFVRWFRGGNMLNMLPVVAAVLAASSFHSGVIAVGVGYMAVVPLYRRSAGRFGLSWESLGYLVLFAIVIRLIVVEYPDLFLGKFERFESGEDLISSANNRRGGSQYLTGLTVNSYAELLALGPLRALYFIGSPMPWDLRGLVDIFTFLTDSLFYLITPVIYVRHRKRLDTPMRHLGDAILITILVVSLVFGAGVANAGTALRHRYKLLALFISLLAVAASRSRREASPPGMTDAAASDRSPLVRVKSPDA